jgi:hypothetical protein
VPWSVRLAYAHWRKLGVNRQNRCFVQRGGEMGQINWPLDQDAPTPDRTFIGESRVVMIRMIVRAAFNAHYVTFSSLVHTAPRFSTHPAAH